MLLLVLFILIFAHPLKIALWLQVVRCQGHPPHARRQHADGGAEVAARGIPLLEQEAGQGPHLVSSSVGGGCLASDMCLARLA